MKALQCRSIDSAGEAGAPGDVLAASTGCMQCCGQGCFAASHSVHAVLVVAQTLRWTGPVACVVLCADVWNMCALCALLRLPQPS